MEDKFILIMLLFSTFFSSCGRGQASNPLTDMLLLDYMTGGSILGIGSGPGGGNRMSSSIEMVSVDSSGVLGNSASYGPSISSDGRYVAFRSYASNLISADTNAYADIFVHDRLTGATTRVSVDSSGVEGNGHAHNASISADGRYVAFSSYASNMVGGDTNACVDVFVHDRQTGVTTRVSVDSSGVQGNNSSGFESPPSISADGRYVAFVSRATNLFGVDTNGAAVPDIFVHDNRTGQTRRVSVDSAGIQGNNTSDIASISADGRYVAFRSYSSNLVANASGSHVFVHDLQTGNTSIVSVNSGGVPGNNISTDPSISADGRYVAFRSTSGNLVPGAGRLDIFVHDRQTGETGVVSISATGVTGNGYSHNPSISGDGRYVTFQSDATNLVTGDTNAQGDVFVHDRQTKMTKRVSVDSSGVEGNSRSEFPAISADGSCIVFESDASNLVSADTNNSWDIFAAPNL